MVTCAILDYVTPHAANDLQRKEKTRSFLSFRLSLPLSKLKVEKAGEMCVYQEVK